MTTYIPHEARLDSYNKEGELVYTRTNYTGTKRSDETTWYKNPGMNSSVKEFTFVDLEGKKQQNRKVITVTKSETGMTTQITDAEGDVLSIDVLTNTADGWHRNITYLDLSTIKEVQSNTVKEFAGTKADVMTLDHVEVDTNSDKPYITATRDQLIRTDRGEDDFEVRAVNGIVTNYEYNVHMVFTAYDVDATTTEIKKNTAPQKMTTQITKTQTNQDGVRLITERIKSAPDIGTYRTMTYGTQSWVKDYEDAEHMVIGAMTTFFSVINGIDDIDHDRTFDDEYRKIDYSKIKWVQTFATYQEDMIGVVPQLKELCVIFVDKDKQAHLKVGAYITYGMDNELGHVNVECTYCTYGTELDSALVEYYQVEPDTNMLGKMKRLAKRVRALAYAKKRATEAAARLIAAEVKSSDDNETTSKAYVTSIFD